MKKPVYTLSDERDVRTSILLAGFLPKACQEEVASSRKWPHIKAEDTVEYS